jgi:hypothetical protein
MARPTRVLFLVMVLFMPTLSSRAIAVQAQATSSPSAQASPSPMSRTSAVMLTEEDVPDGLVTIDDRQRTLDEVSAGFQSPDAARAQFEAWGWKGNSVRAFHIAGDATPDPGAIDGIYISVHEFGTPGDAANALDYSVKIHLAATDLEEMPLEPMGDSSVAIYGAVSYGNEVTLYVQQDTLLIRLSASSPEGDPRPEAIELVRTMLRG